MPPVARYNVANAATRPGAVVDSPAPWSVYEFNHVPGAVSSDPPLLPVTSAIARRSPVPPTTAGVVIDGDDPLLCVLFAATKVPVALMPDAAISLNADRDADPIVYCTLVSDPVAILNQIPEPWNCPEPRCDVACAHPDDSGRPAPEVVA